MNANTHHRTASKLQDVSIQLWRGLEIIDALRDRLSELEGPEDDRAIALCEVAASTVNNAKSELDIATLQLRGSPDRSAWDAAYSAERAARAAIATAQGEDAVDAASDAHGVPFGNLLKLDAPDLAALRVKLERLFENDDQVSWNHDIMDGLRADWRRLLPLSDQEG